MQVPLKGFLSLLENESEQHASAVLVFLGVMDEGAFEQTNAMTSFGSEAQISVRLQGAPGLPGSL